MNGIAYSHYDRWYRIIRNSQVIPVEVVDKDYLSVIVENLSVLSVDKSPVCVVSVLSLDIRFSSVLPVQQDDLTYVSLRSLIEKLEALCWYYADLITYINILMCRLF